METFYYNSRLGALKITTEKNFVTEIHFLNKDHQATRPKTAFGKKVQRELDEYFSKKRANFTIKFKFEGTEFQKDVWNELRKIKYAETASYKDIAKRIRRPKAIRAVGTACGRNPLPIIIPCHRVLASNGGLGGFSGGLSNKKWLLGHEKLRK